MSTSNHPTVLLSRDVNLSPTKAMKPLFPMKTSKMEEEKSFNEEDKDRSLRDEKPKSMEYHRQVLQSRLEAEKSKTPTYVSPSDTIMSPCTAKLSAYKSKHFLKAKPQSLFSKIEAKTAKPVVEKGEEGI